MVATPIREEAATSYARCVIAVGAIIALQALILWAMDHPLICTCGRIDFWHGNHAGPETSQHLTDWYTPSHVIHGLLFYLLLWLVAPRLSVGTRLVMAVGLEAAWEVIENTPWLMARYREGALAAGYFGDSIVNSVADTFAMMLGFVLARLLPPWSTVVLAVALELVALVSIRDNLTLNIIQLLHPTEAISRWQTGE
jgi:hypothetical protein